MENLKKLFIAFLFTMAFLYFCFGFIYANFNFANWDIGARVFIIAVSLIVSYIFFIKSICDCINNNSTLQILNDVEKTAGKCNGRDLLTVPDESITPW